MHLLPLPFFALSGRDHHTKAGAIVIVNERRDGSAACQAKQKMVRQKVWGLHFVVFGQVCFLGGNTAFLVSSFLPVVERNNCTAQKI
jgi:hypothetical protein